jgi:hypothetical protein
MFYLAFLLLAQMPIESKSQIDEVTVSDLNETITLRADGTAEYRYRGRPNDLINDERVGFFTAKLEKRWFERVAAPLVDVDIDKLEDFRMPFPQRITLIRLTRDGRQKTLQIHDRNVASDPHPPNRLWTLEMTVRGLGTCLHWEPIKTGLRLEFKDNSEEVRAIYIREPETNFPVVIVLSKKKVVELPLKPGKYSVEVELLRDSHLTDAVKTPATVEAEGYTAVSLDQ